MENECFADDNKDFPQEKVINEHQKLINKDNR